VTELQNVPAAQGRIRALNERVFASEAFETVSEAAKEAIRDLTKWSLDVFLERVWNTAGEALDAFRVAVDDAEEELAAEGIQFWTDVARVVDTSSEVLILEFKNHTCRSVLRQMAAGRVGREGLVVVDHVDVFGSGRDFVRTIPRRHYAPDLVLGWDAEFGSRAEKLEAYRVLSSHDRRHAVVEESLQEAVEQGIL
jgi:hypothetical protein